MGGNTFNPFKYSGNYMYHLRWDEGMECFDCSGMPLKTERENFAVPVSSCGFHRRLMMMITVLKIIVSTETLLLAGKISTFPTPVV
jgi:hypothetical protein